MITHEQLQELTGPLLDDQPYPLLLAVLDGAHLYGCPSADSDLDIRGIHLLPPREVLGLEPARDTIELSWEGEGVPIDLVTYDLKKACHLLTRKNAGSILEVIFSPLVLVESEEAAGLRDLVKGCITCHHGRHYIGFGRNQWKLFEKQNPPSVKALLYVVRVLLTGVHLMEAREVECHLPRLGEIYRLDYVDDLVRRKMDQGDKAVVGSEEMDFYRGEYQRWLARLEEAREKTDLPEVPEKRRELSEFLVRLRLAIKENLPGQGDM